MVGGQEISEQITLRELISFDVIYNEDCLSLMQRMPKNSINLIYIDPPFGFSADKKFGMQAWKDNHQERNDVDIIFNFERLKTKIGVINYLRFMYVRLKLMHDLLAGDGSIYVHCDWRVNSYLKLILDDIFGEENFRNEIVWHYRTYQGQVENYFPRKHDLILFYSKSEKYLFKLLKEKDFTKNIDYIRWQKYLVNDCEIRGDNYPKLILVLMFL